MTLTSVSVVMAVMVINLYYRGNKARRPPYLLRYVVLNWLSKIVMLRHNIEQLARTLNLVSISLTFSLKSSIIS